MTIFIYDCNLINSEVFLAKTLVGLILLTTVLSLLVVVGWFGAGITGSAVQDVSPVFDGLSTGIVVLIILGVILLFVEVRLYSRGRS